MGPYNLKKKLDIIITKISFFILFNSFRYYNIIIYYYYYIFLIDNQ